jgi:hypothetical protein
VSSGASSARFFRPTPKLTTRDLVGDAFQGAGDLPLVRAEVGQAQVGADGGVAAGDVEAHADHGDLVAVRGHPADRHHVAHVAVGHQRGTLGARGHVLELAEGVPRRAARRYMEWNELHLQLLTAPAARTRR